MIKGITKQLAITTSKLEGIEWPGDIPTDNKKAENAKKQYKITKSIISSDNFKTADLHAHFFFLKRASPGLK